MLAKRALCWLLSSLRKMVDEDALRDDAMRLIDIVLAMRHVLDGFDVIQLLQEAWEHGKAERRAEERAAATAAKEAKAEARAQALAEKKEAAERARAEKEADEERIRREVEANEERIRMQEEQQRVEREAKLADELVAASAARVEARKEVERQAALGGLLPPAPLMESESPLAKAPFTAADPRHSTAGSAAATRLKRANSRLETLKGSSPRSAAALTGPNASATPASDEFEVDEDAIGDGEWRKSKAKMYVVENPAAIRARKLAEALASAKGPAKAADPDATDLDVQLRTMLFNDMRTQAVSSAWLQPWRAGGSGVKTLSRELDAICGWTSDCVAIDDGDGDTIACIGGDGKKTSVSVFTVTSGNVVHLQGHTGQVCAVAIHGDVVASSSRDKSIRLWSRKSGSCDATLKCDEQAYGLALMGDRLISGEGGQKTAKARLWSVSEARELAVYTGHTGPIWSVTLAVDLAVTGSSDKTARVWNVGATGRHANLGSLAHPAIVHSVDVAANDADVVATGCGDGQVRLWSLATLTCLRTLEHGGGGLNANLLQSLSPVYAVRLCGGLLFSGAQDQKIHVWDLATNGQSVAAVTLPHGANVIGLAVSSHGYVVSASSKKLVLWRSAA